VRANKSRPLPKLSKHSKHVFGPPALPPSAENCCFVFFLILYFKNVFAVFLFFWCVFCVFCFFVFCSLFLCLFASI
jgi:hypothetical protein